MNEREVAADATNPLGLEGIEFIEYATARPQALGHVLELMGFHPVARHRSREVTLYRQGDMNVVVNAHGGAVAPAEAPAISAIALRVRDAAAAYRRVLERGAWEVPVQVAPMELHIPAIHGAGTSRIYFVDRHKEFSIYDVDFVPIPGVDRRPASPAGLRWFGIVQYIGRDRLDDWCAFYSALFGFRLLADDERFGILPSGRVLASPCGGFYLQLIEPEAGAPDGDECLQRVAFGTQDVLAAVAALRERGVGFVETPGVHTGQRGALTQTWLDTTMFELVHAE
ncbi:VOC family protein [Aquincola sp. MAHUQ-54]|uniref:VOC family protein n=1 Tax=Aquincola agrisoli TaxID=3119538 RepID=A0AAW9QFN9_9BURK